ncbi:probable cytochrome P450 6a17 isoform X2 [Halyomorpha halys]|nr:probable cytochrome P450 6a17 isoform X2 [Halyomorpha halys]
MLIVTDPEIVKRILVTDFNSFYNSGFDLSTTVDPIMGLNPFTIKTIPEWKEIRGMQAAHQTQVKLRELIPGFLKVSDNMFGYIKNQKNQPIKVLDFAFRLTVDFAVLNAFGIEPRSFTDPDFGFIKHASAENIFSANYLNTFGALFFPLLCRLFSLRLVTKEAEGFFVSMSKSNLQHRLSANITRSDLFDTVVKSQKKKDGQKNKVYNQSEMVIAAACANFYVDATITSSSVLSFMLLELANHQDIQEKLREEILSVGKKPEDFDFEKINTMTYLQMVFDECMRMHAPVSSLSRTCTKDIVINDVTISKGTKVFIAASAFHQDPEYYSEPKKFDPERFSDVNKQSRVKYTYLPFGEGPRICVGFKYGTLAVKISVIFVLLKYRIVACVDANESLYDPNEFFLTPKADATMKLEEL